MYRKAGFHRQLGPATSVPACLHLLKPQDNEKFTVLFLGSLLIRSAQPLSALTLRSA